VKSAHGRNGLAKGGRPKVNRDRHPGRDRRHHELACRGAPETGVRAANTEIPRTSTNCRRARRGSAGSAGTSGQSSRNGNLRIRGRAGLRQAQAGEPGDPRKKRRDLFRRDLLRPDLLRPDLFRRDLLRPDLFRRDLLRPDLLRPDLFGPALIRPLQSLQLLHERRPLQVE